MSAIVVIRRADNGVSVCHLAAEADPDVVVAKWALTADSSWLPIVGHAVADSSQLPASRRWRNAWRVSGGNIVTPLPAARALRKAELLREREERVAKVLRRLRTAEARGNATLAVALRDRLLALEDVDATVDAQLAAVADLATLNAWKPTEMVPED